MNKQDHFEMKSGIFVLFGLSVFIISILILSGPEKLFIHKKHYYAQFKKVDGLIHGAKVILSGVPVGTVENIFLESQTQSIHVKFSVIQDATLWIKKDSQIEIATQGMLGDKYLSIYPGSPDSPVLPENSFIQDHKQLDFLELLSKGDTLLYSFNELLKSLSYTLGQFHKDKNSETFFKSLAQTSQNLSHITANLNQDIAGLEIKKISKEIYDIVNKINSGKGTLGLLINNTTLHDEFQKILGGINRNRIMRNLIRKIAEEEQEKNLK